MNGKVLNAASPDISGLRVGAGIDFPSGDGLASPHRHWAYSVTFPLHFLPRWNG